VEWPAGFREFWQKVSSPWLGISSREPPSFATAEVAANATTTTMLLLGLVAGERRKRLT